jgi:TRAP-type C4-dicarboxylate transport system permease small subunit
MYNCIKKINGQVKKIVDVLMVASMSLMTLFIFAQVIYRYVLKQPLSWSEEVSRYLFSCVTLFGAVLLYRGNSHINMSLLKDLIKVKFVQTLLDILAQVLVLVFLGVVIRYGFPMSVQIIKFSVISPSMPWLKMGYVFMLLPVAAVLSVLAVLEVICSIAMRLKAGEADKWA